MSSDVRCCEVVSLLTYLFILILQICLLGMQSRTLLSEKNTQGTYSNSARRDISEINTRCNAQFRMSRDVPLYSLRIRFVTKCNPTSIDQLQFHSTQHASVAKGLNTSD